MEYFANSVDPIVVTSIIAACRSGSVKELTNAMNSSKSSYSVHSLLTIRDKDHYNQMPLHIAADHGHTDLVRYLLSDSVRLQMFPQRTPSRRQLCEQLRCERHGTALHTAVHNGRMETVRFLVEECGCDPNHTLLDRWPTNCLHFAAQGGHLQMVRYFLEAPHSMKPDTYDVWSPLHYAGGSVWDHSRWSEADNEERLAVMRLLMDEYGCDPNRPCLLQGQTPLHSVAQHGDVSAARFLIELCHCDPRAKCLLGHNALHMACRENNVEVALYLVDMCKMDPLDPCGGHVTPFEMLVANPALETLQALTGYLSDTSSFERPRVSPRLPLLSASLLVQALADSLARLLQIKRVMLRQKIKTPTDIFYVEPAIPRPDLAIWVREYRNIRDPTYSLEGVFIRACQCTIVLFWFLVNNSAYNSVPLKTTDGAAEEEALVKLKSTLAQKNLRSLEAADLLILSFVCATACIPLIDAIHRMGTRCQADVELEVVVPTEGVAVISKQTRHTRAMSFHPRVATDTEGLTVLHMLARRPVGMAFTRETVKVLCDHYGCDVNSRAGRNLLTPLHELHNVSEKACVTGYKALIDRGADLNSTSDPTYFVPLHCLVSSTRVVAEAVPIVSCLLDGGADINAMPSDFLLFRDIRRIHGDEKGNALIKGHFCADTEEDGSSAGSPSTGLDASLTSASTASTESPAIWRKRPAGFKNMTEFRRFRRANDVTPLDLARRSCDEQRSAAARRLVSFLVAEGAQTREEIHGVGDDLYDNQQCCIF